MIFYHYSLLKYLILFHFYQNLCQSNGNTTHPLCKFQYDHIFLYFQKIKDLLVEELHTILCNKKDVYKNFLFEKSLEVYLCDA